MTRNSLKNGLLGCLSLFALGGLVMASAEPARADGMVSLKDAPVMTNSEWAGHWLVRLRATYIVPEDDVDRATVYPGLGGPFGIPTPLAGTGADISNQLIPELDVSYFLTNNFAVEVICCATKHGVDATGTLYNSISGAVGLLGGVQYGAEVASTWVMPATILLQYHMDMGNGFKPYVGAGPTYALFLGEDVGGLLSGVASKVHVADNWGFTFQAGADMAIGNNMYLNLDVKKMFLRTDITWTGTGPLAGQNLVADNLEVSPWIFSVGLGMKF